MSVSVLGAGAFGTALAIAIAKTHQGVQLWGRNAQGMRALQATRTTPYVPGVTLPDALSVTEDLTNALSADILLLAVPAQALPKMLADLPAQSKPLVACCKGMNLQSLTGPTEVIAHSHPAATSLVLTGPSFAADIAQGLPTALTLACAQADVGRAVQHALATPTLRLYLSQDVRGAELGGALKNVIAIACGVVVGARLGDSARAALMTRGFAEMQRLVQHLGADPATLYGLSGLGDLALTCSSEQSRNYSYGKDLALTGSTVTQKTVEGAATARAIRDLAAKLDLELPICNVVANLVENRTTVAQAIETLLSRPIKEENP